MKKFALFLAIITLFTLGSTPYRPANSLTIRADQVTSASDIEILISKASNNGALPLTVIFDSSRGPFHYSADDRSINLFYSNLKLVSTNGAVFDNCGDGFFFDEAEVNNITIQGLTFMCEGLGIAGGSGHKRVTIRNNTFIAGDTSGGYGVAMENAEDWLITGNSVKSGGRGIFMIRSKNMTVTRNTVESNEGINLEETSFTTVAGNTISNASLGIIIGLSSSSNQVSANRLNNVKVSGIVFVGGNENNRVINNRVACAAGAACDLIRVDDPPLSATNQVRANKFAK